MPMTQSRLFSTIVLMGCALGAGGCSDSHANVCPPNCADAGPDASQDMGADMYVDMHHPDMDLGPPDGGWPPTK